MPFAGSDQHVVGPQDIAAGGFLDRHPGEGIKPPCQRLGELRRHVLHDQDRRHGQPKLLEEAGMPFPGQPSNVGPRAPDGGGAADAA